MKTVSGMFGAMAMMLLPFLGFGQQEMRFNLNPTGDRYVKLTFTNQLWLRANQSNPGTLVMGESAPNTFDIGLRRTRMQLFGQVTDRMFF